MLIGLGRAKGALANEVMLELSLLDKGQSCAEVGEGGAPQAEETARLTLEGRTGSLLQDYRGGQVADDE